MKHPKINACVVLGLWALLTAFSWFSPAKALSESERRPLAQKPELSAATLLDGRFMKNFDKFSLDQFPLRDQFRTLKSLFHLYGMQQMDNNGIYLTNGFAVKQEYPLKEDSVRHALNRFQNVYDKLLAQGDHKIYMAVVPDKGHFLAEGSHHLTLDQSALQQMVRDGAPWATQVDLLPTLSADNYYRTDTHWRQETLLETAGVLARAMGVPAPQAEDFTVTTFETPFYGVYYGQAALPMAPDTISILESEVLRNATVYNYETGKTLPVYNLDKLEEKDPYEVFLSGPRSLLTIQNPAGDPARKLIVFRDSFGSSLVPLLAEGYSEVTLVDIRYIQVEMLSRFLQLDDQDVLFLYSSLVLNNSSALK